MNSSRTDDDLPVAMSVQCTDGELVVRLSDGRTASVPLAWYPRLLHATPEERANWRLTGKGYGIHWPDLDEDIRAHDVADGRRSGESAASFARWLDARAHHVP